MNVDVRLVGHERNFRHFARIHHERQPKQRIRTGAFPHSAIRSSFNCCIALSSKKSQERSGGEEAAAAAQNALRSRTRKRSRNGESIEESRS